jgi:hypothetical protein
MMNNVSFLWELREAQAHLGALIRKLSSEASIEGDDDLSISIDIEHVINHICFAWHCRNLSAEEIGAISQEKFEEYTTSIPNFGFDLKMLNGLDITDNANK